MTFEDLKFEEHKNYPLMDKQSIVEFKNGFGLSIVNGKHADCSHDSYEVAILKNGSLCYDSGITEDVLGYQTKEDINNLLEQVSNL